VKKEEFDHLFDEAFEKSAKSLPNPDPNSSWEQVMKTIQKRQKRRSILSILPYLAASFLLGAVIFGSPAVTNAFNPIYEIFKKIQSDVVTLIFTNGQQEKGKAKTAPPPDSFTSQEPFTSQEGQVLESQTYAETHYPTWQEASKHVLFTPYTFSYVPENYEITDVFLLNKSDEQLSSQAVLSFSNEKDNKSFMLRIRSMEKNEQLTSSSDTSAGDLETVEINGTKAYLFIHKDGRTLLEYLMSNTFISISGNLTKEEIIEFSNHMK
jgi:hypothetical protein